MIGRSNEDVGIVIISQYAVNSPRYTWCSVTMDGLGQHVLRGDVGELLPHKILIDDIRTHVNVFGWYKVCHPSIGLLQQCGVRSEEIDKLLWHFLSATRPQPATFSAGQDNTIVMVVHGFCYLNERFCLLNYTLYII